jgi:hypothetical protein
MTGKDVSDLTAERIKALEIFVLAMAARGGPEWLVGLVLQIL